jgi:uncharacterized damage-inducible protein DinB
MIKQAMINEIKHEGAQTKKLLERVPFDKFNWSPHEKSMQLGKLAVHVAEIPRWSSRILTATEFDFTKGGYKQAEVHRTEELVQLSENNIQKALDDFNATTDEDLFAPWTFRRGEHIIFTLPRAAAIRTLAMNHLLHHRGQLSVYLRLLDIPIPGMYGPSADEQF